MFNVIASATKHLSPELFKSRSNTNFCQHCSMLDLHLLAAICYLWLPFIFDWLHHLVPQIPSPVFQILSPLLVFPCSSSGKPNQTWLMHKTIYCSACCWYYYYHHETPSLAPHWNVPRLHANRVIVPTSRRLKAANENQPKRPDTIRGFIIIYH